MALRYLGYRLVQQLSSCLPSRILFRCAEGVADAQWRCSPRDGVAVRTNLGLALNASIEDHSPLVRDVFRNFGRYLVEFFSVHRVPQPSVTIDGLHYLEEAQRHRRGTIVLTAHLGNWEVGAVLIRRMGFPLVAVALPHDEPRMNRLFNEQRRRCGIEVIPLGHDAVHRSLRHLRHGRLLGLLGDVEFTGNGLTVPFCGRQVVFPRGPATLSLRSRAPVVPTFLVREGDWKFRLCFEPPLWPETHPGTEAGVRTITQSYADVLQRYLRRFANQWLVFRPIVEVG